MTTTPPPAPPETTAPVGEPAGRPDERRRGPRWGAIGGGLLLIAAGILWLLSLAGVDLRWELILPATVIGLGVLVLVTARSGDNGGLIGLGVLLAVVAVFASILPVPVSVSAGERNIQVTEAADLKPSYALGAGSLTLDLRDLDPTGGRTTVAAQVTFGELIVRVPPDVRVEVDASAGAGEVEVFDEVEDGLNPRVSTSVPGAEDGGAVLVLDLGVAFGAVEVVR